MPYIAQGSKTVMLSGGEVATVLNVLRYLMNNGSPHKEETDLYFSLKTIAEEAIGLEQNRGGWWYEPEMGEV